MAVEGLSRDCDLSAESIGNAGETFAMKGCDGVPVHSIWSESNLP